MSHLSNIKWSGSPPRSPVFSQWAESQCDVIDAALAQSSEGVQALLDGVYPALSRRHGVAQQLLLLTRQRHLLVLSRQFVVHQRSLRNYMKDVCELLGRRPPIPSLLVPMCLRLRKITAQSALQHRRLRGDPCLYPIPSPSVHNATRNLPQILLLMEVQAALLTEQFILHVLRRVAQAPSEGITDLHSSLTAYNQVVTDLSKRVGPLAALRPFCLKRTIEILVEERSQALLGRLCCMWSQCGLEDLWREMENHMNRTTDPALRESISLLEKSQVVPGHRSSCSLEVLVREDRSQMTPVLKKSQMVRGQRSSCSMGVLVQEDRCQMIPVLQILVSLDQKMWNKVPSSSESALYSQYSAHLGPALYSHVFHAFCLGMRGPWTLPALLSLPEGVCASAVHTLRDAVTSEDLPEPYVSLGHRLCQRFDCVQSLIAWDSMLCQALSSALTDKCAASTLVSRGPDSGNLSRTSSILVTLCQHLSTLLVTPSSSLQSPSQEPWNMTDHLSCPPSSELCAITCQRGVLSRGTVSLHLCDMWLRSRAQMFVSSGSLSHLVLITHGDLPVMRAECRSLVAAAENAAWLPSTQTSCMTIKRSWDALEGLLVSLPHVVGSVCSQKAQDLFRHMMPAGRHWRGKLVTGPDLAPSEYAQVAVSTVVVPVLAGVQLLCLEEQVSAVCVAVAVFMEAWMGHILRAKMKFSLQGALQLRRDFESVRDVLRSQTRLSPEVVQAALALPVFAQADNAIVCLLQQPSRKVYLQSGNCAVFSCCPPLCRVAVDSLSDSLQSLDSLERRAWDGDGSGRVPRHSHDSYLPHNQRQWLSLRVHRTCNGLSLPWEGREVSEG